MNTKQTEALKLALEALESVTGHFTRTPSTLRDSEVRGEEHKAITVIREALMSFQDGAQSRSDVKPLTEEQMFELAEIAWRHGWASCRDAEYVGEEAEDERWGMVGAEVVQDIAAHGIMSGTDGKEKNA